MLARRSSKKVTVFGNSQYAQDIILLEEFISESERAIMHYSPRESSRLFQVLTALAANVYTPDNRLDPNMILNKHYMDIFSIATAKDFRSAQTIFQTKDVISKIDCHPIIKDSMDYFYFNFLNESDQIKIPLLKFDKKDDSWMQENEERRRRKFGMDLSLNLLNDMARSSKSQEMALKISEVYQNTRYGIDCMTYYSSPKIDSEVFRIISNSRKENKNRKAVFLGIGCAWGDDEANLLNMQAKESNPLFDKIYATDLSPDFLFVAKNRHKDLDLIFKKVSIYDLNKDTLKSIGVGSEDYLCTFMSGVLSRVDNPFKQLSNALELSDIVIISEGFPFKSDSVYHKRNKIEDMNHFIERMRSSNSIATKSSKILLEKTINWEVMTLRDGYERFNNQLAVAENTIRRPR